MTLLHKTRTRHIIYLKHQTQFSFETPVCFSNRRILTAHPNFVTRSPQILLCKYVKACIDRW